MLNFSFTKLFLLVLGFFVLFFSTLGVSHAELILQGKLQRSLRQAPAEEKVRVNLRIYDDEFAGRLIFAEAQEFSAKTEALSFRLGQGDVTVSDKSGAPAPEKLWVEVEIDNQVLSPRISLAAINENQELTGSDLRLAEAVLRTDGPATLVISDLGVSFNGLLDMGSQSIKLGGVERNDWPAGGDSGWTDDGAVVSLTTSSDKVGIGTANPQTALHVTGNDGVLFGGTLDSGTALNLGAGTRMMWYPKKAAFRVGSVSWTQWDDPNIGYDSIAMGEETTASGYSSTAMGSQTVASGFYSTAMGILTTASDQQSTAMGYFTKASGWSSTAMGQGTTASGAHSTAMGLATIASGYSSTAIGSWNVGGGAADSWVDTDPLFEIGNGTDDAHRANAVTVYKNGNTHISGKLTSGSSNVSLPIAYGVINTAGSVNNVTNNISCSWVTDHYEITITGESYSQTAYVSTVEVLGTNPVMSSTTASGDNLSVYIYDTSGTNIQNAFHFVIYKL